MMTVLYFAAIAAGAYFLGGLNGAIITSRLVYREDIRQHGSGNAGLTNFLRTYGGRAVFLLVLIDVIKTALPVILGGVFLTNVLSYGNPDDRMMIGRMWGGLFAVLGHSYPCLYKFKGGKGILSGGTVAIFVDFRVALVVWGLFFLFVILTRYVSLGSIAAASALPVGFLIFGMNFWATLLALACGAFVVFRHRDNMVRLLRGQERRLSFGKKREEDGS